MDKTTWVSSAEVRRSGQSVYVLKRLLAGLTDGLDIDCERMRERQGCLLPFGPEH